MGKCATVGCNNDAVTGAAYCVGCRNKMNERKDGVLKLLAGIGAACVAFVAAIPVIIGWKDSRS